MKNIPLTFASLVIFLLTACAHKQQTDFPLSLKDDLHLADTKCTAQKFENAADRIKCFNDVETLVIQKDVPIVLPAFNHFSAQRQFLADQLDENLVEEEQELNNYKLEENQNSEYFKASYPKMTDKNSDVSKEIIAATRKKHCPETPEYDKIKCAQEIVRPIIENDLPEAIDDFDHLFARRLILARKADTIRSSENFQSELADFKRGMENIKTDYEEDARRAFVSAASQNKVSENNANADMHVLGQIVEAVGAAALIAGAVIVAKHSQGGGGGNYSSCCKVCSVGMACGNTCITREDICYAPVGCACNAY